MSSAPERVKSLRRRLRSVDAILVTQLNNVRYLTGFTGSSGFALVTKNENVLVTDFRYKEQSQKEVSGWDVAIDNRGVTAAARRLGKKLGINTLGLEDTAQLRLYDALKRNFKKVNPMKSVVEKLRTVKDADELDAIKAAVRVAETGFRRIRPRIRAGVTERAIALGLEEALRKEGSEGLPFDIIVAAGENSAMPHAKPSARRLQPGDLVIVDWGARVGGYCSDMTRTFLLKGKGLARKKEVYSLVLNANRKAVKAARPKVRAASVDKAARGVIGKAGYGECFGHATGHGVGLNVHESPSISTRSRDTLKAGVVFTVEPGVYIPGLGGVRIEDMVAVGSRGCKELTSLPRRLEII